MDKGTQIAYVPNHVVVDEGGSWQTHRDVQFGFVMSSNSPDTHFCRYWAKGHEGGELRTKANSERTPNDYLMQFDYVPQILVEQMIDIIERD
jgi:hypothetical protein